MMNIFDFIMEKRSHLYLVLIIVSLTGIVIGSEIEKYLLLRKFIQVLMDLQENTLNNLKIALAIAFK